MTGSRNKWYNELSPDGVDAGSSNDFASVRGEGWVTGVLTWRGKKMRSYLDLPGLPGIVPTPVKVMGIIFSLYPSGLLCTEMAQSKSLLTEINSCLINHQ